MGLHGIPKPMPRSKRLQRGCEHSKYITVAEFDLVKAQAHFTVADAMDLALLTGQRQADVLKLKRTDIREVGLWIVQNKTGARLGIEITGDREWGGVKPLR